MEVSTKQYIVNDEAVANKQMFKIVKKNNTPELLIF